MGFLSQNSKMSLSPMTLILAVILCLTGCGAAGAGQTAGQTDSQTNGQATTAASDLNKEEMAVLCYYRGQEKDEAWDSDMEIVKGRIDALTDGKYIMEETVLETSEGPFPAMEFYVPKELYGNYSLKVISSIMISRPMNLWICENKSTGTYNTFVDQIELPRDAIESVEVLYGCPESINPLDYGSDREEFTYLKVTLSEEFTGQNPQIWEWKQPNILQDYEEYKNDSYGNYLVLTDRENRCLYWIEREQQKNYCKSFLYSYTHEPLSAGFDFLALSVVEWESGEEIKGAGQIEAGDFKTATVVYSYVPEQVYITDANWEQALKAIRERMDASGVPYALGHLPGHDQSVVIRLEDGIFSSDFMDFIVSDTDVSLSTRGEECYEDLSVVKVSPSVQDGKKVLKVDMSEIKKYTLGKLSLACSKIGGSRIVLNVNDRAMAYGYCDSVITDGVFIMDRNALTAEEGFINELEWLPEFLGAVIGGTPFPMISTYYPAVTLKNTEKANLSEEGKLWIPKARYYSQESLFDEIRLRLGGMEYSMLGTLTSGTPCLQFAMPEGETRNEQIAAKLSQLFRSLSEDIFTYGFRFDFVDEKGTPVIRIPVNGTFKNGQSKISYFLFYEGVLTEADREEIKKALEADESVSDLVDYDF